MAAPRGKRKIRKNIPTGIVHIRSTFNNTLVTITDVNGNAISWASSGIRGFRGSRKSTPFAAQLAADQAARSAQDHGMQTVAIRVSGPFENLSYDPTTPRTAERTDKAADSAGQQIDKTVKGVKDWFKKKK